MNRVIDGYDMCGHVWKAYSSLHRLLRLTPRGSAQELFPRHATQPLNGSAVAGLSFFFPCFVSHLYLLVHSGSQAANGVATGLKRFLINEKELNGYLPC